MVKKKRSHKHYQIYLIQRRLWFLRCIHYTYTAECAVPVFQIFSKSHTYLPCLIQFINMWAFLSFFFSFLNSWYCITHKYICVYSRAYSKEIAIAALKVEAPSEANNIAYRQLYTRSCCLKGNICTIATSNDA